MTPNRKLFFMMLLTAAFSSLATYFMVAPSPKTVDTVPMQQALVNEQKQVQTIDASYTQRMNKLKQQNDSLTKVVQSRRAALMVSDQKVLQLEDKVAALAVKVKSEPDSIKGKVHDLDTLGTEASVLVIQEAQRDSLCESEVNGLSSVVTEKDSALSECQNSYIQLRQVADSSLQQQQLAITEIKGLNKQLKRKAAQSRLLSAGILILGGAAATLYLLHH